MHAGKSRPPRTPRLAGQAAGSSLQLSGNPFWSPSAHESTSSISAEDSTPRHSPDKQARKTASSKARAATGKEVAGEVEEPKEDASIKAGERMYAEALRSLERQRTAAQLTIQVSVALFCSNQCMLCSYHG